MDDPIDPTWVVACPNCGAWDADWQLRCRLCGAVPDLPDPDSPDSTEVLPPED